MNRNELARIAHAMVAKGRGILAADESTGTIKKRFDKINVESTEENRRGYRELLFTAPGAAEYISGVILYDETLRQSTKAGERFADLLTRLGIVPGIKVDGGTKPLPNFPGEIITEGLDGLPAAGRVPQARRALRQVARSHRHRRRHPDPHLHRGQRRAAGALRGAVPGGRDRADRRARGADGRRPHAGALRGGHERRARRGVRAPRGRTGSTSRAWCSSPTW